MKQCGRCGTQNLDQQAACTGCGGVLPSAPFGMGTLVMPGANQAAPAPAAAPPPASPGVGLRGTMIGMAPPGFVIPTAATAPTPATEPAPAGPRFGATMLGMPVAAAQQVLGAPAQASGPASGAPPARVVSAQKTMLGVARPGIAPLNPGQVRPASVPAPSWSPPQASFPSTAPAPSQRSPSLPAGRKPRRISAVTAVVLVAVAMLVAAAASVYFIGKGRGSVTAKAGLDDNGKELLELTCPECVDGTRAWTDAAQATFRGGKAQLQLTVPLRVGENPIVVGIERPSRRREEIALSVPVEYRVRGSMDELGQAVPKLSVIASALPGVSLIVDGKPVKADPNGAARFDFDVENELSGAEATVKILERRVPYSVTLPGGSPKTGEVQVRVGITPLVLDAPGTLIVVGTEEVIIAGRTAPGASLQLGTEDIPLDPAGRFTKKQPLNPGENPFVLRATLRDHAPRLLPLLVRRTDNLAREAALARAMAQVTYEEVLRAGEAAIGRAVAFEGSLFDLRRDGYSSLILLDVSERCPKGPCLAKILYGTEISANRGAPLRAFGKIVRFVDGPRTGQRIPEVRAELLIVGEK